MYALKIVPTGRKTGLADQAGSLAIILREEFGVTFHFFDAASGRPLETEEGGDGPLAAADNPAWLAEFGATEQVDLGAASGGFYRLGLSLHEDGNPALVAVGFLAPLNRTGPEAAQERVRLQKWLRSVHERLRLAHRSQARHRAEPPRDRERDPGAETPVAWEAILRIEHLLRTTRIDKDPDRNVKRVLRAAGDLIGVRVLAWVPARADEPVLLDGERLLSPWDFGQLSTTLAQNRDWEQAGFLVENTAANASWSARFPNVKNVLAVPVGERCQSGWLVALNKTAPPAPETPAGLATIPFRRADAALLTPFASLLACQSHATQRCKSLMDLLVGLTRALTAAIDAKDSYTYGHSERVARIAVELGRELGLQEHELSDIYLAGLLHDIGKIGIRDSVLGKTGKLTDEEYEHIKEHVRIGHRILAGLRVIAHLLPGVLYHHERIDGKGYPEGLQGNAIPFLARILAVADSYDAMSTSRPYRDAMAPARTEEILRAGSGTQWDKTVIDAFIRSKGRVHAIRQRGVGESLCNALGDALRRGTTGQAQSVRPG